MRDSPVRSDEEAVKVWLRDYSGELLSVGITLGLTAAQLLELHARLVSIRQDFDVTTASEGRFCSGRDSGQPETDPMKLRWLDEHCDWAQQGQRGA